MEESDRDEKGIVIDTMASGIQFTPDLLARGARKDCKQRIYCVVDTTSDDDEPGSIEHDGVQCSNRAKYA
jgi:hypothetical protein